MRRDEEIGKKRGEEKERGRERKEEKERRPRPSERTLLARGPFALFASSKGREKTRGSKGTSPGPFGRPVFLS